MAVLENNMSMRKQPLQTFIPTAAGRQQGFIPGRPQKATDPCGKCRKAF